MQSKLNEILEICIDKSSHENKVFYVFEFDNLYSILTIKKINLINGVNEDRMFHEIELDKALEHMQKE